MFPKLSGGVAVYAHEAWKRYTSFVGPIAAVGYWLGWSVVLSLNGAIVGCLLQARSSPDSTFGIDAQGAIWGIVNFYSSPAILDRRRHDPRDLGGQRLGRPPRGLDRLRDRRPAAVPARSSSSSCPYITGDWSSSNLHNFIDWGNFNTYETRARATRSSTTTAGGS